MEIKRPMKSRSFVLTMLMLGLFTASGCREAKENTEVVTLEGKVEKIELAQGGLGQLTISYHSDKHDQDMVGTGLVTDETEIMINGIVASLADIREGEHIRGEVRVEKKGDDRKQIAMKIHVDRAVPIGG